MFTTERVWVARTFGLTIAAMALIVGGCSDEVDGFSAEEWRRVQMISPLATPMPANPYDDRADDDAVAKLGQKLFYEKDQSEAITVTGPSGNMGDLGKVGCVNCHDNKYFADSRPIPLSHGRTFSGHNTPAMVNLGWYEWTLWTGSLDSLSTHGANAWGSTATPLAQAHYLYKKYRDEYNAAFPDDMLDPALDPTAPDAARFPATATPKGNLAADGAFERMTKDDQWKIHRMKANLGKAFDAHPRKLITRNSKFEQYIRGTDRSEASFSARAKNGLRLFIGKASCIDCHNGPVLSDNQFHNIGVAPLLFAPGTTTTAATIDRGRGGVFNGLLNNALATLRTNEHLTRMDPIMDEVPVFTGAGQFSSNPTAGLARLVKLEADLCKPGGRTAEAVPAVCATLFRAPRLANPDVVPPVLADAGDPRYQTCVDANSEIGLCASLNGVDAKGVAIIVANFNASFEGTFRTPSLLNIAETGPYFHTGEVKTLREVVWHYNNGGGTAGLFPETKSPRIRPLLLTDSEMDDIVEFLKTLTGDAPDYEWACNPLLGPPLVGCGPPGAGATGGASGAGGRGGASGASGGTGGRGGVTGSAGSSGTGGSTGTGGSVGTGGAPSTGGVTGTGGAADTGGVSGNGGVTGVGGEGGA